MWVLRNKLTSSGRAVHTIDYWAIFLAIILKPPNHVYLYLFIFLITFWEFHTWVLCQQYFYLSLLQLLPCPHPLPLKLLSYSLIITVKCTLHMCNLLNSYSVAYMCMCRADHSILNSLSGSMSLKETDSSPCSQQLWIANNSSYRCQALWDLPNPHWFFNWNFHYTGLVEAAILRVHECSFLPYTEDTI